MRQPITPRPGQDIKAEHLISHAQAIEWLYSRLKGNDRGVIADDQSEDFSGPFKLDNTPIAGVKSAIITGGTVISFSPYITGSRTINIPSFTIDLKVPLVKLLWVKINAVAKFYASPYSGIFDCGVTSISQSPSGISIGDSYPQGLSPNGVTGIGYHIEPLGKLTVESGEARFEYVSKGFINLFQFSGSFYGDRSLD